MKKDILLICIAFGLAGLSCSKVDTQSLGLKQSIEKSTAAINTAIGKISETKGYQILSSGAGSTAKALETESFTDSINLKLIAGIYDFQFDTILHPLHFDYPFRLFKKTATSDNMIVNLPHKLIFNPWYLHNYSKSDSILTNDFTIKATDYHLYYSLWKNLDYKITAGLTLKSEDLGSFNVSSLSSSFFDHSYSSEYTFTGGYNISTAWQTGDTTKSTFALIKDNGAMLKETTLFIKTDSYKREKQYDLTIGNVEIKRGNTDSIQVYLDGVLQKTAGAKITDNTDATGSICYNRDIQITYDDGTSTKLSTLLSPALNDLKTLIGSLHDMFFAENVVNYIATNIYYNSR